MTESSLCFPQEHSDAKWAIEVMLSMSAAILNFTDFHDAFCEACGNAGLIREYLELLEQLRSVRQSLKIKRWEFYLLLPITLTLSLRGSCC